MHFAAEACKAKMLSHGFVLHEEKMVTLTDDQAGEFLGVAPALAQDLAGFVQLGHHLKRYGDWT